MRVFHELILDKMIEGVAFPNTSWDMRAAWMIPLGYVERVAFMTVADIASGVTPSLAVNLYENPSGRYSEFRFLKALNNGALSTTDTTVFKGQWSNGDGSYPPSKYLYVAAFLSGSNAKAHVRVWATGRGEQPLPAEPMPPRTLSEEVERARTWAEAPTNGREEVSVVSPKMWLPAH